MTVFLTPDRRPFFAGTYFPKSSHHGRPGFVDVLRAVRAAWDEQRDDITDQADQLTATIRARSTFADVDADAPLSEDLLRTAYAALRNGFDPEWGGFGREPKFPQVSFIELVFRAWSRNRSDETKAIITRTLDAMAAGGIYDHIGGGFARYSVDNSWTIPHFEKMLYDQAQLVRAYTHGWQVTGDERYSQVVEETIGYVLRDMHDPVRGIYSAEDADAEGEEGKFTVWRPDVVAAVLDGDGLTGAALDWWGITPEGNFEHGTTNPRRPLGGALIRPPDIERARQLLFDAREKRVRPGLDDKVLTEWNAMFISALAEAGAAFSRQDWLDDAAGTGDFLLASLRRDDGRWLRSWQRGRAQHLAYAVDYAWLIDAFVRLAEARGEARWIDAARSAADGLMALFTDRESGGFFTTGDDAEQLLVRQKDYYDGATPSANGVAALALLRLGALTGERTYTDAGERVLRWLADPMAQQPTAFTYSLAALDFWLEGATEVVVLGEPEPAIQELVHSVQAHYRPNVVLAWGERYDSPLWEGRTPGHAYVCRDYACLVPVMTATELADQLQ